MTVVIASYNHEKYVGRAVASVLEQSYPAIEVIVVDDGSPDRTPEVVAAFRDPRVRLIRLKENRAFHPRNIGIEYATGKYVAFQNSDDVWEPGKLEAQVGYMETHKDCAVCFTRVEIIDRSGGKAINTWAEGLFAAENRSSSAWLRHFFFYGNCLPLPSALVGREALLRAGGFRPSLIQLSDFDLWIRLAAIGELHIIEKPLTNLRIVEGENLSQPSPKTSRRSEIEHSVVLGRYLESAILERFEEVFPEWSQYREAGARKVALALHNLGKSSGRILFGDRTIADVLDNPTERKQALAAHGKAFIHAFLEHRGEINLSGNRQALV